MAERFAKLAEAAGLSPYERAVLLHLSSSWAVLAWATEFLETLDKDPSSSFQ